jgi:hypothetical protein
LAEQRELLEKSAKSEAKNTELEAQISELLLRVRMQETRVNAIQMESDRDKKAMESQFNARLMLAESEHRAGLEEARIAGQTAKTRITEAIGSQFAGLADGIKVNESNLELVLQIVRKRIDALNTRESFLREILELDPTQSLEEAVNAIVQKRKRR